jgi:hypothetical protein
MIFSEVDGTTTELCMVGDEHLLAAALSSDSTLGFAISADRLLPSVRNFPFFLKLTEDKSFLQLKEEHLNAYKRMLPRIESIKIGSNKGRREFPE